MRKIIEKHGEASLFFFDGGGLQMVRSLYIDNLCVNLRCMSSKDLNDIPCSWVTLTPSLWRQETHPPLPVDFAMCWNLYTGVREAIVG